MKKRVLKICAMFMALILMVSSETQYAFAQEQEIGENQETGIKFEMFEMGVEDIEISLPDTDVIVADKNMLVDDQAVETDGDEVVLYSPAEFQTFAMDDASTLRYGTVSGSLTAAGTYDLYSIELSAEDYLQAKLTLPNVASIDYDLVLYDSEFNMITKSDYYTFQNQTGTLEESIGYKAAADETVYFGIFSVGGDGDSNTAVYTVDFSITTNFSDDSEPDEHAREATALTVNTSGTSVSRKLNSPLDNDWYVFTVLDTPSYDKIRLKLTSSSATNGCNVEIYYNLLSDDTYAMQFLGSLGSGKEGEIGLPAGTYYLRVVSTNNFLNFNSGDIPTYTLSVSSVPRVDAIEISNFAGYNGVHTAVYPEGNLFRMDQNPNWYNYVTILGMAYTIDQFGNKHGAPNVRINAMVIDEQWADDGRDDLAYVYGSTVTDSRGTFTMTVWLNEARGGKMYDTGDSWHYYDLMRARITTTSSSATHERKFYYLQKSIWHGRL